MADISLSFRHMALVRQTPSHASQGLSETATFSEPSQILMEIWRKQKIARVKSTNDRRKSGRRWISPWVFGLWLSFDKRRLTHPIGFLKLFYFRRTELYWWRYGENRFSHTLNRPTPTQKWMKTDISISFRRILVVQRPASQASHRISETVWLSENWAILVEIWRKQIFSRVKSTESGWRRISLSVFDGYLWFNPTMVCSK